MTSDARTVSAKAMPDHIRSVFQTYARLMTAGDLDGIVALYAPDAVVEDPVGTVPQRGHEAIRKWYASSFAGVGGGIQMELEGAVRVAGSHGAAALRASTPHSKQPIAIETVDVMHFNADGMITLMSAYWGPTNLKPLNVG